MLLPLFLLLILQLPCLVCRVNLSKCFSLVDHGVSKDGDVMLAAFFPVCLYYVYVSPLFPAEKPAFRR